MKVLLFCVVAFIASHSAEAVSVSVSFDWDRLWNNIDAHAYCDSDYVDSLHKVSTLRFWSLDSSVNLLFEAHRNCTGDSDISTAFDVTQDSTNGRILVQMQMNNRTTLYWNRPQWNESSLYMCSLTPCWSSVEYPSNNTQYLTIVRYNQKPVMSSPNVTNLTVFEDVSVNLTFVCSGFTGYPNGSLQLEEKDNGMKLLLFEISNTGDGNLISSATLTRQYTRVNKPAYTCYTVNTASGQVLIQESSTFRVSVEYKPVDNWFISNNLLAPVTQLAPGEFEMRTVLPLDVQVACVADGNPKPFVHLAQVEGLPQYVETVNQSTAAIRVDFNVTVAVTEVRLKLQCNSTYQSTLPEQGTAHLTSFLTITAEMPQAQTSTKLTPSSTNGAASLTQLPCFLLVFVLLRLCLSQ